MGDGDVIVGEAVDQHKRADESRRILHDADEQMFGGDVFVAHLLHFLFGLGDGGGQLTAGLRL